MLINNFWYKIKINLEVKKNTWYLLMIKNKLMWRVAVIGTAFMLLITYFIRMHLIFKLGTTIPILPGILHFTYNSGEAVATFFAFTGQNFKYLYVLISLVSLALITSIIFFISWVISRQKIMIKSLQIGLGLLLAGSISNHIERLLFDSVSVYIDFRLLNLSIINIADIFIYLGLLISAISLVFLVIKFVVKKMAR